MLSINKMEFTSNVNRDNGLTNSSIGELTYSMELFTDTDNGDYFIEWDLPLIEETLTIGLCFDEGNNLTDYDGVFELPIQAVTLLRKSGFHVSERFIS